MLKKLRLNFFNLVSLLSQIYSIKSTHLLWSVYIKNEQMLAGGTLSEDQKDMFFAAISKAYFINKEHAREKFGRKKSDS